MVFFLKKYFFALKLIMLIVIVLVISSCKKMDPNPELKDKIYLDLKKIASELEKKAETGRKALPDLNATVSKEKTRSLSLRLARKKLKEAKAKQVFLDQDAHYAKIRVEKRRVYGRRAYKIAFQKGESWPNKSLYKRYETNKRLRAADLNWNKRVPKLQSANPNFSGNKSKE